MLSEMRRCVLWVGVEMWKVTPSKSETTWSMEAGGALVWMFVSLWLVRGQVLGVVGGKCGVDVVLDRDCDIGRLVQIKYVPREPLFQQRLDQDVLVVE